MSRRNHITETDSIVLSKRLKGIVDGALDGLQVIEQWHATRWLDQCFRSASLSNKFPKHRSSTVARNYPEDPGSCVTLFWSNRYESQGGSRWLLLKLWRYRAVRLSTQSTIGPSTNPKTYPRYPIQDEAHAREFCCPIEQVQGYSQQLDHGMAVDSDFSFSFWSQ